MAELVEIVVSGNSLSNADATVKQTGQNVNVSNATNSFVIIFWSGASVDYSASFSVDVSLDGTIFHPFDKQTATGSFGSYGQSYPGLAVRFIRITVNAPTAGTGGIVSAIISGKT